ncbi:MAG: hypothetical protein Q4A04_08440 [Eubacteriales bacterium]|nr:hypothetical protein [Eubacteriales bacterium]
MSVNSGDRKHGKMEVLVAAKSLAAYTIKICCNGNWFPIQYNNAITQKLIDCATNIFICCWTANNIRVDESAEKLKRRNDLQGDAIRDCNNLLALMQIAQEVFHLTTNRIKYWGEKTLYVRTLIGKWRDSDSKRLSL